MIAMSTSQGSNVQRRLLKYVKILDGAKAVSSFDTLHIPCATHEAFASLLTTRDVHFKSCPILFDPLCAHVP